jgi:DNA-binding MarR family transcriptional regulator
MSVAIAAESTRPYGAPSTLVPLDLILSDLSHTAVRSYMALRSEATKHGVQGVTQAQVAKVAGRARSAFLKGLEELVAAGFVVKHRKSGMKTISSYSFPKQEGTFAYPTNAVVRLAMEKLTNREIRVLALLYAKNSQTNVTVLARIVGIDKSNLFHALRSLKQHGFVCRCDHCGQWHFMDLPSDDLDCARPEIAPERGVTEGTTGVSPTVKRPAPVGVSQTASTLKTPTTARKQESKKTEKSGARRAPEVNDMPKPLNDDLFASGADDQQETPTVTQELFATPPSMESRKHPGGRRPVVTRHHPERAVDRTGLADLYDDWMFALYPKVLNSRKDRQKLQRWMKNMAAHGWDVDTIRDAITRYFRLRESQGVPPFAGQHVFVFMAWAKSNAASLTTPAVSTENWG